MKLYKDALDMLEKFENQQVLQINANVGFYQTYTEGDDIIIDSGNEKFTSQLCGNKRHLLRILLCLADLSILPEII